MPDSGDYWNTLGAAYCQAGDWNAAAQALDKAGELLRPSARDGTNFCYRTIAHWHLGHKTEARDCYDRAVVLLQKYAPNDPVRRRLRTETQKLIESRTP